MMNSTTPAILSIFALLLLAACTPSPDGPDEAQQALLKNHVSRWASAMNGGKWDSLPALFAPEVNFNGEQTSGPQAAATIRKFFFDTYRLDVRLNPSSWTLDSMNADVYSGHLTGFISYLGQDSLSTQVDLWLKLTDGASPLIVAQFDKFAAQYNLLKRRESDRILAGQDFDSTGCPNFTFWQTLAEDLSPKLGQLRYFTKYGPQRLFYAMDKGGTKMGIADEHGAQVLPYAFDDIGGIGIILPDVVEVRQGDKYGLVKMDGAVLLPAEFDAILPIFGDNAPGVWVMKAGTWTRYDQQGQPMAAEGGGPAPDNGPQWLPYLRSLPLETAWNPKSTQFQGARLNSFYGDDDQEYTDLGGIFRPPFALTRWHVLEDAGVFPYEGNDAALQRFQSVEAADGGNLRIFKEVERWGFGARETYHAMESEWTVFPPDLKDTLQAIKLLWEDLDPIENCQNYELTTLGDTAIRVRASQFYLGSLGYEFAPGFKYYRILRDGRLQHLLPEREFPFMSLQLIDVKFLQGCFWGSPNEQEYEAYKRTHPSDEEMPLRRTAAHFRAADLDFMINEVYAAHGYIFKKDKWARHFADKKWYHPQSADVEALLTPIERANVTFLRDLQTRMKGREAEFTKPTIEPYIAAG